MLPGASPGRRSEFSREPRRALDWGLSGERASPQPVTSPPSCRGRGNNRHARSRRTKHCTCRLRGPLRSGRGWRAAASDLFPVELRHRDARHDVPCSTARECASSEGAQSTAYASSDLSVDDLDVASLADLDDASLAALLEDDYADAGAQPFKRLGFAVYLVVMMLVGASLSALVFHARVSRIIVQWQSVSASASPPTATPVKHD